MTNKKQSKKKNRGFNQEKNGKKKIQIKILIPVRISGHHLIPMMYDFLSRTTALRHCAFYINRRWFLY